MWNPMQKNVILITLAFVFIMAISGAVSAADGSNIVNDTTDCDKITKNVTNLNGSNTINYNDTVKFTIKARNDHHSSGKFRVMDTLPSGLQFVSYTATKGTYNTATGIWTIGSLNSYGTATITILAKVIDSDTCITNTATLQREEYDRYHHCYEWDYEAKANTTFCVPKAVDLEVDKTVNSSNPNYKDCVTWTVTAKNKGPDCATGVKVNDLLPSGLQFVSYTATTGTYDAATGIWTIGDLDSLCDAVLNIITRVNASCTSITNTACITGCEYDPCLANNEACASICVPCAADLEVNKAVNNTKPKYKDTVNYTITAKNLGPDNATGVKVTDLLPAGLQFVSYNASAGTYDAATGIWSIGNLDAWCQAVLNIIAEVNTTNTCINNSANITGCEYDPCLTNNNAGTNICIPAQSNLYIKITVPTECLDITDIAHITFKIGNKGPNTAENTVFTWKIPEGMEYISASVDQGTFTYNPATRTITWTLGDVPVGDPYMWISVKILKEGTFEIRPTLSTSTYDPDLVYNVEFADICGEGGTAGGGGKTNGTGGETVNAATIPMHETGLPISLLIAAIMMVFAGLVAPKRK